MSLKVHFVSGVDASTLLQWADAADRPEVLPPGITHPRTKQEAIDVAKANALRVKAFHDMPLTVWNKVFEYSGWEHIDTMEQASSVFVRTPTVSPNCLQDCRAYYLNNRTIVLPGLELQQPMRHAGNFQESGQPMDLPQLTPLFKAVSQELVDFQSRHAPLHQGITPSDLLQVDDLPFMFTHFFSAEEQPDPTFRARATRLARLLERITSSDLLKRITSSDITLSREDFINISRCGRQIVRILFELALHYSDFQCRSSRLEELNQAITAISPEIGELTNEMMLNTTE